MNTEIINTSKEESISSNVNPYPPLLKFSPPLSKRIWDCVSSPSFLTAVGTTALTSLTNSSWSFCAVAVGGVLITKNLFKKIISGGDYLRPGVFLGAEGMSVTDVQGGILSLTIPPIYESLRELNTENAKIIQSCLDNILSYLNSFDYSGLGNSALIEHQQKVVARLEPGQITALPCGWFAPTVGVGHVMIVSICSKPNKKFLLKIFNAGEGAVYHYQKSATLPDDTLTLEHVQVTLEIDEVRQTELQNFIADIAKLHAFRPKNSSKKLYEEIIPKLNGIILEPNKDPRLWMHPQSGNSCSGYTLKCLIKSILSVTEYKQFMSIFLSRTEEKLKNGLESPWRFWEHTSYHQITLKEIRIKLLQIENKNTLESKTDSDTKISFQSLDDNVTKPIGLLGCIAEKTQKKFWQAIFDPLSVLKENDPNDYLEYKLTKLKILYLIRQNIDLRIAFSYKDPNRQVISKGKPKQCVEINSLSHKEICNAIKDIYESNNVKDISRSERVKIDKYYQEFLDEIEERYRPFKSLSIGLANFLSELFFHVVKMHDAQKAPISNQLYSAVKMFKKGEFNESFECLKKAYEQINQLKSISIEEIGGCIHVMHEFIPLAANCPTQSVSNAKTLEEIEFHIANAVIFKKLSALIADSRLSFYYISDVGSFTPLIWGNEFNRYSCLGLLHFSKGPWKKEMEEQYHRYQKCASLLEAEIANPPIIGIKLKDL